MIEEEDHPQHPDERWLVSYADFITLLFALFVLLYALSNSSKAKEAAGINSVATAAGMRPASGSGGVRPGLSQSPGKTVAAPQLDAAKAQVSAALKQYSNSGVSMTVDARGLVISLSAAKFFASGEDEITAAQLPVLEAVIKTMAPWPNSFEIDGFTDSVPIHQRQVSRQLGSQFGARVECSSLYPGALGDYPGPSRGRRLRPLSRGG